MRAIQYVELMRKIVISDIHGCNQTFNKVLSSVQVEKKDQLLLLGDYIDRGPDSKGVLDTIMHLQEQGFNVKCLMGNHEKMFLDALHNDSETDYQFWYRNGGKETLESFKTQEIKDVTSKYVDFIESLFRFHEDENFIYVHAGLDMRAGDPYSQKEAMLWIREWYRHIDKQWLANRVIIHGHTVEERVLIQKSLENLDQIPVVNIDNGCYYDEGYYPLGYHGLCALILTNPAGCTVADLPKYMELFFEKCVDVV